MTTKATLAGDFYNKVFALAQQYATAANDAPGGVQTKAGRMAMPISYAADLLTMGEIQSTQVPATTNRGRDETVGVGLTCSSFRTGELDAAAEDAMNSAFALANNVATHVCNALINDPDMGADVHWAFLTQVDATGVEIPNQGVLWEVDVIFQAQIRVRG